MKTVWYVSNYRYASPEYIQATLPKYYSTAEQYKNGISQVGAVASWPIADRWSIVGAYYYDTNANKQADSMLGVQYVSCCYAIRVGYERKLNGWDNDKQHAVYDNAIGFNIELRGLKPTTVWVRKRCCVRTFCRIKTLCDLLIYHVIRSAVN